MILKQNIHEEDGYKVICDHTGRAIVIEATRIEATGGGYAISKSVQHLRYLLGTFPYGRVPDIKKEHARDRLNFILSIIIGICVGHALLWLYLLTR